jgi:Carboxypeptidase regulatory-like domain
VVTTDAAGRFSMPGVPAGTIILRASKPNYSTATQGALVTPGTNTPFTFSLEPFNPVAVNITGLVTDGNDVAVPDARISINWPVPGSTVTDTAGAYNLALSVRPPDPMRPGAWWGPAAILAQKSGHEPDERYATLAPRTPVNFRLYPIIRLPPGAMTFLAIANDDPYCYEVTHAFSSDPPAWSCRTVRMSPAQSGTLTLDVEWDDTAAVLGLQVRDGRSGWLCCDAHQSNRVSSGTELLVDVVLINGRVNRPPPLGSVPFVLKTSLTRD